MYSTPPRTPIVLTKAKAAYSLWLIAFNDIPKVCRQTLGKKIDNSFLELLEAIFVSMYLSPQQKCLKLTTAIAKLDAVNFFLQLAWENKSINQQRYVVLSSCLNEIGRMLGGWKKGLENKTPAL